MTSEQVWTALRALGVPAFEGGSAGTSSRAELLGQLLAVTEWALLTEQGQVAVGASRRGYFEVLDSQVRAADVREAMQAAAMQELYVRSIDLRVRRAASDWNFLRERLPAEAGQHHVAAALGLLLLAVTELVEPFYPKAREPLARHVGRFRGAVNAASGRLASAHRALAAFRQVQRAFGFKD